MKWQLIAVHEAGHAVIAAHLRIPFKDVSGFGKLRFFRRCHDCLIPYDTVSFFQRYAVVCLASRAAVDEILPGQETDEEIAYKGDEQNLAKTAEVLGIPQADFRAWGRGSAR